MPKRLFILFCSLCLVAFATACGSDPTPTPTPVRARATATQDVALILELTSTPPATETPVPTDTPVPTITPPPPPSQTPKPTNPPAPTRTTQPSRTPQPTNRPAPKVTNPPTVTPLFITAAQLTPVATRIPKADPAQLLKTPLPKFIQNQILFFSTGYTLKFPLVMSPEGKLTLALTGPDLYNLAAVSESYSPDRTKQTVVEKDPNGILQVWIADLTYGTRQLVSHNTKDIAFDPVWSPDGGRIAYVSRESGNDEIYVYDIGANASQQLTFTEGQLLYNQHPTWSPDSSRIIFQSNRDIYRFQIWIMNADGSDQHIFYSSPYNDTAPLWVK